MVIHGYTVDNNLPAFRKAFYLPDILTELNNQFAIWKWVVGMRDLPHLSQNIKDRLSKLLAAMSDFFGEKEYSENWKTVLITGIKCNTELQKQILNSEEKIDSRKKSQFYCLSYIVLELMEIADYTATEQDLHIFLEYLQKQDYRSGTSSGFAHQQLRIKLHNEKKPQLYCGDQIVTDLPDGRKNLLGEFVTVAEDPAAGYLGITKDGKLVNGSAFVIPELQKRPVKVLLNQMYYVILQEDGSLTHNLRFCTELPPVPVRDVTLSKDHIQWKPI